MNWCFRIIRMYSQKWNCQVKTTTLSSHLQTMAVLLPPFQFGCLLFLFLTCTMARTPNTALNRSAESRLPCIVPDLSGKAFSFCPLSMRLAVGLSYMTFIMLSYGPSTPTLLSVFINGCCTLSNAFSTPIDMIM